jgi:hypothetical protein
MLKPTSSLVTGNVIFLFCLMITGVMVKVRYSHSTYFCVVLLFSVLTLYHSKYHEGREPFSYWFWVFFCLFFFVVFFVVLRLELRAFTLSHSASPFCDGYF